jgi:hypothetical protein
MRSKEAFAYSKSTGYFCSVAASTVRVRGSSERPDRRGDSNPRVGTCHDATVIDVTGDYTAQNLSVGQRDVMKLIARALSNKEIASIFNLAEGTVKILTAKECLQSAEVCQALAHKTKKLGTRAALLEFAYEFRTVAKRLERDERKLMVRAASDGMQKHGV